MSKAPPLIHKLWVPCTHAIEWKTTFIRIILHRTHKSLLYYLYARHAFNFIPAHVNKIKRNVKRGGCSRFLNFVLYSRMLSTSQCNTIHGRIWYGHVSHSQKIKLMQWWNSKIILQHSMDHTSLWPTEWTKAYYYHILYLFFHI